MFDGYSYLNHMFILPEYRGLNFSKVLSNERWAYIKKKPNKFNRLAFVVEVRGIYFDSEYSPFLQEIIKTRKLNKNKLKQLQFKDLRRVITPYLPKKIDLQKSSQDLKNLINKPHCESFSVINMLRNLGFKKSPYIGAFSGGAVMIYNEDM